MMESKNAMTNPSTPTATGTPANNDGSYVLRTPASAYRVPTADFDQSLESLASQYTHRLGQSPAPVPSTMYPNMMSQYAAQWSSSENVTENATTYPASPLSSTTQTLVDNWNFPAMYAPTEQFDFSAFFGPNTASSSTPVECGFSDSELAFLNGLSYPAAGLTAPVSAPVALPDMEPLKDIGKGKAREVTPTAPATPIKLAPAPVAGVKRGVSEVTGADEEVEEVERPAKSSRALTKREQNRLAAQRSRARKVEERDGLEREVSELKDKIRELETALQTKNAENRVLREYMGRK